MKKVISLCLGLILLSGCASSIKYDSQADPETLRALRGKTVVLLAFDSTHNQLVDATPLDLEVTKAVAAQHKTDFVQEFQPLFSLRDVSPEVATGSSDPADDPATFARQALQRVNADAGFIVTNSYAYEMASGSVKDSVIESFLKKVLPESWVGPIVGPSQIQSYDFASNVTLYDRTGKVIWSFYGKAGATPRFSQMFKPGDFARSVAGLDPSAQNLAGAMAGIGKSYSHYVSWMVQRDIDKSPKNYFLDYPSDKRDDHLGVFPASDTSHVPYVKGYDPLSRQPEQPHK